MSTKTLPSKLAERTAKLIAKMTDENRHSEAALTLAKAFGTKEQISAASSVKKEHERLGHITDELHAKRDAVINGVIADMRANGLGVSADILWEAF